MNNATENLRVRKCRSLNNHRTLPDFEKFEKYYSRKFELMMPA